MKILLIELCFVRVISNYEFILGIDIFLFFLMLWVVEFFIDNLCLDNMCLVGCLGF